VVLFGVNASELAEARRDQERAPRCCGDKFGGKALGEQPWGGKVLMKSIQTDTSDPIPLRTSPHGIGTITIRFVGLLVVAVVILALAWSR
jgi:hypothetical protein